MDLSIVIPFFNEEDNVRDALNSIEYALKNNKIKYEIVAVDNGSSDRTEAILRELKENMGSLKIVRVHVNEGYGWGIRCGLKEAAGEYIGFMCGDNQIEPKAILDVYNKVRIENLDLGKVRRVQRYDGFIRKIISFFYNIICPKLFSIGEKDLNGTPKIFKRSIFEKLNLISKGWFIDAEIMIKVSRMGCKIGEVPVVFKKREKGSSKVNIKAVLAFSGEMFSYRCKYRKD